MITMNYIASFFLIFLGLYCIVVKHNAVKTVIGLCVMDYGVNIFLISPPSARRTGIFCRFGSVLLIRPVAVIV